ncbi:MAG: hypothetical protein JST58_07935 [Bacteroidetes bacterium]|nr:hypothetical protein [Bacteroidota bacterium]
MQTENKPQTRENKLVYWAALLAGFLLIAGSLIRALSINNLVVASSTGDISKHYSNSVIIDWALASILMLLVGVWLLFLASPLKKRQRRAWWQAFIISLSLISFGAGFFYRFPQSIHLAVFVLIGLLLFLPLILFVGRFGKEA